jgi:hypothetical protein
MIFVYSVIISVSTNLFFTVRMFYVCVIVCFMIFMLVCMNGHEFVRFEVLTTLDMEILIFWEVKPCCLQNFDIISDSLTCWKTCPEMGLKIV